MTTKENTKLPKPRNVRGLPSAGKHRHNNIAASTFDCFSLPLKLANVASLTKQGVQSTATVSYTHLTLPTKRIV